MSDYKIEQVGEMVMPVILVSGKKLYKIGNMLIVRKPDGKLEKTSVMANSWLYEEIDSVNGSDKIIVYYDGQTFEKKERYFIKLDKIEESHELDV